MIISYTRQEIFNKETQAGIILNFPSKTAALVEKLIKTFIQPADQDAKNTLKSRIQWVFQKIRNFGSAKFYVNAKSAEKRFIASIYNLIRMLTEKKMGVSAGRKRRSVCPRAEAETARKAMTSINF